MRGKQVSSTKAICSSCNLATFYTRRSAPSGKRALQMFAHSNSLQYCWRSHYILESSCRASCCDSRMLAIVSRSIAISRSFAANVVLAAVFVEPLLLPLSWTVAREMSATHAHPHSCMHVVISLRHNKSTRHNQPITRHTNARIIIPRSNDD
jgi:hypothetical protein